MSPSAICYFHCLSVCVAAGAGWPDGSGLVDVSVWRPPDQHTSQEVQRSGRYSQQEEGVRPSQYPPQEPVPVTVPVRPGYCPSQECVGPGQYPSQECVGPGQYPSQECVGPGYCPSQEGVRPGYCPSQEGVRPGYCPPQEGPRPVRFPAPPNNVGDQTAGARVSTLPRQTRLSGEARHDRHPGGTVS